MASWLLWISNTQHRTQALPIAHFSLVCLNTHCQRPVETTQRQSGIIRLRRIGVCNPRPVLLARCSFITGHHEAASRQQGLTIHSSRRRFAARLNSGVRRHTQFLCPRKRADLSIAKSLSGKGTAIIFACTASSKSSTLGLSSRAVITSTLKQHKIKLPS